MISIGWFLSLLLKSGVEVIVLVSLLVRIFQRRDLREHIANLVALTWFNEGFLAMPRWVIMMHLFSNDSSTVAFSVLDLLLEKYLMCKCQEYLFFQILYFQI